MPKLTPEEKMAKFIKKLETVDRPNQLKYYTLHGIPVVFYLIQTGKEDLMAQLVKKNGVDYNQTYWLNIKSQNYLFTVLSYATHCASSKWGWGSPKEGFNDQITIVEYLLQGIEHWQGRPEHQTKKYSGDKFLVPQQIDRGNNELLVEYVTPLEIIVKLADNLREEDGINLINYCLDLLGTDQALTNPDQYLYILAKTKYPINYNDPRYAVRAYHDRDFPATRYSSSKMPKYDLPFAGNLCSPSIYLPVSRYEGAEGGGNAKYCGVFFYYVGNSNNYLNMGRCLIAASKLDAYEQLRRENATIKYDGDEEEQKHYDRMKMSIATTLQNAFMDYGVHKYAWGETYLDMDNALQTMRLLIEDLDHIPVVELKGVKNRNPERSWKLDEEGDPIIPMKTGPQVEVPGTHSEFFNLMFEDKEGKRLQRLNDGLGPLDSLDQELCKLARALGYDTVLLQRESGTYSVRTEIMDVRPKDISYQNLCINKQKTKFTEIANSVPSKFQDIYLPKYGFEILPHFSWGAANEDGITNLMILVANDNVPLIQHSDIPSGILNQLSKDGFTALDFAKSQAMRDILRSKGAR